MSGAPHLDVRLVVLVAGGGAVGTAARYLLSGLLPPAAGWPVGTLTANVLGSFLLGALLEALLRRGAESRRGRRVRLAVGTGILGGFTTFSSLALELERMLVAGELGTALLYAGVSLLAGVAACFLGIVVAQRHGGRRGIPGSLTRTGQGTRALAPGEQVGP